MALSRDDIRTLFDRHGDIAYSGKPVTQREHAPQTAVLVTAAPLHDLGHLLNRQGETPSGRGIDNQHQYFALPFLRALSRCRA
ncbi:phosphohydrolase [Ralstonia solanacearum]|uniref:Uncharacterized protein n=1 Tax=Ralstonia solanacearum TaxID=305 RepID=A0A0S4X1D7_RALSL|nr:hypothetical protein LBM341_02980 [Ralstonia solanacearum]ESS51575.1 hypothetical protein L665_04923 [Ralstonia solanacearum SD54]BEU49863.1 hypothetical protein MAFF211520_01550 [Ralstonia pseudosolanacearum]NJZ67834.1 phosphohydrolase [Ralstonia solanacearum]NJZ77166.1 phosphohydrolase [Ralstonia solanacearum]